MASVIANGQSTEIKLPCRLADFLTRAGWKPTQIVVELNGEVVQRNRVEEIELRESDRLEVIVPVAGG